jgi:hypothetical protein
MAQEPRARALRASEEPKGRGGNASRLFSPVGAGLLRDKASLAHKRQKRPRAARGVAKGREGEPGSLE